MKFNAYIVQSIETTTSHDNFMNAKAEFLAPAVPLCIPYGLPLAACCLQIELTRKDGKGAALGLIELRGTTLVEFMKNSTITTISSPSGKGKAVNTASSTSITNKQWLDMRKPTGTAAVAHGGLGAALGAGMAFLSHTHDTTGDKGVLGAPTVKMQIVASYSPIPQEKYKLDVVSARNLPKADVFGSR